MIARLIYSGLIALHPTGFRRQFGDEMRSIFDEITAAGCSGLRLISDGVVSLARQWLLRSGCWRPCASLMLSAVLFTGLPFLSVRHIRPWQISDESADSPSLALLVHLAAFAVTIIAAVLFATVYWSHEVTRQRRRSCLSSSARSRSGTAASPLSIR
jgi:hypothetical protein